MPLSFPEPMLTIAKSTDCKVSILNNLVQQMEKCDILYCLRAIKEHIAVEHYDSKDELLGSQSPLSSLHSVLDLPPPTFWHFQTLKDGGWCNE